MPGSQNPQFDISNSKLKFGLWFVTHKILLKKILIGTLIGLNAIFYVFSIYKLINILIINRTNYQETLTGLTQPTIDYQYWREAQKPSDLVISSLKILPSSSGRIDVIASITNPNQQFAVKEINYNFTSGDKILATGKTYVWPGEQKYLIGFGIPNADVGSINLEIAGLSWQRFSNFSEILSDKYNFQVQDIKLTNQEIFETGEASKFSQTEFTIFNNTAYDFWEAGFLVLLKSNDEIIGANFTKLDSFKSLEKRKININWPIIYGNATAISVIPEVNILDENIFMKSNGSPGELK